MTLYSIDLFPYFLYTNYVKQSLLFPAKEHLKEMKTPLSSLTGTAINTDRISVASKQRTVRIDQSPEQSEPASQQTSFRREVPMPKGAEFVEIDGKKYFLDAPRGTYLNILV